MDFFQSAQQALQPVGEADGAGGVGHQERAHDQQHDPQHHEHGVLQTLRGDPQEAQLCQDVLSRREEQVQNAGEHDDEHHRLQPPHQGFDPYSGDADTHCQHRRQNAVGQQALGAEQRHDVKDHQQDLRPGVQAVGHGVAGEKLAQGDVLQHPVSPLLSASSSRSRASTV